MWMKLCHGDAPSMVEASSISVGMFINTPVGNEHLVGHAHPDVDEDDHELCPVLVGQEGNVVHVLPQQADGL